jgi:two-component system chemotaxis sensor kinase CheA
MSEKMKVLIVDDDADFRAVVRDILEMKTPYEVIDADGGAKALILLKEHSSNIICVISDYKMPEMNGFELREKMMDEYANREKMMDEYANIPTVILSGYVTREMAISGVETKISAFISKPVESKELLDTLEKQSKNRVDEIEEREILEQSFIEESQSIIEELEPLILGLESNPSDLDLLNTIFRLVHTVKGASGVLDNPLITSYLHKYEDLLQKLKSQALSATPEIVTILLNGFDGMSSLIDAVGAKREPEFSIEDSIRSFEAAAAGKVDSTHSQDAQAATADKVKKSSSKKEAQITIQTALLDEFLEQSGEIMVIRNMINKLVMTIEKKLPGEEATIMLSDLLEEMHKINSVMQSMIVDLRKVPMNKVLKTIPRAVRDVARMLGKKVDLQFKGDDLRIDNTIGKVLSESLIHLVRNAVDHGLEMPDVRREAGKHEEGKVLISSYLDGEDVIVELSDDGGGINPENIKKKLRSIGYSEEAIRVMPEAKLFSMIFDSGFSTAAEVTNVSGRGVGLDMVRASIEDIGGRIDTLSDYGKGTTFKLVLPIPKSVLIISSMLVEVGGDTFLLPQDDVLRLIQVPQDQLDDHLVEVEGGTLLSVENRLLPIVSARKILGFEDAPRSSSYVVVRTSENGDFAFEVDKVLDAEDVVVKKAGKYMNHLEIYKGATFMGEWQSRFDTGH